ncbi:metallophosphoesterase family protein [Gilvimarinus agarilyticus]|uniref:metallophosphoesterase family protein n=1 Tax=Gilvimarinus agarilyticus TaxID=679259 RepID=UPI000B304B74|nr:metallophosphoesterase family protein [Gilvimarinus agarilyticus]
MSTHATPTPPWAKLGRYQGKKWLPMALPTECQPWLDEGKHALRQHKKGHRRARHGIHQWMTQYEWHWPKRRVIFISDLHADADALLASLTASGGVKRTGTSDRHFALTKQGKASVFVFGGDFFDKGPSNLRLLRVLKHLIELNAKVELLAGNHDVRVLYGMRTAGNANDPLNGHFFVRMGAKAIPFLQEIRDEYLTGDKALAGVPGTQKCRQLLLPKPAWFNEFPEQAKTHLSAPACERELKKIAKKTAAFEQQCQDAGLSLKEAYASAKLWQKLFLSPKGEFYWFFNTLKLASKRGSFLFVHAGLDDHLADEINKHGIKPLNKAFSKQLKGAPFDFYYGSLANSVRTKYRDVDHPLSKHGSKRAHMAGIHAIVHGHRNLHHGQRLALRRELLHFECDITLDKHSRKKESLPGLGAGATLIDPSGFIAGISSDWPVIKIFQPESV